MLKIDKGIQGALQILLPAVKEIPNAASMLMISQALPQANALIISLCRNPTTATI